MNLDLLAQVLQTRATISKLDRFDVIQTLFENSPVMSTEAHNRQILFSMWLLDLFEKFPTMYNVVYFEHCIKAWAPSFFKEPEEFFVDIVSLLAEYNWPSQYEVLIEKGKSAFKNAEAIRETMMFNTGKNGTMHILIGAPGSGKSTFLKDVNRDCIISRDDFIMETYGHLVGEGDNAYHSCYNASINDKTCDSRFMSMAKQKITNYEDVWIDMTNMNIAGRRKWILQANENSKQVVCYHALTSFDVCLQRQNTRPDKTISKDVLVDMFLRHQVPWLGIECTHLTTLSDLR